MPTPALILQAPNTPREVSLIDVDLHLAPGPDLLFDYLAGWARDLVGADRRRMGPRQVFLNFGTLLRPDCVGPNGEVPGTHMETCKEYVLGRQQTDFGVLTPLHSGGADPRLNGAIHRALNTWQADTWLKEDDVRLFGSICLGIDHPAQAVREIEHWAGHPGFVQVLVQPDGDRPFGHPMYDEIWAAAARRGLPVAIHFTESNRRQIGATPTGRFNTYFEYHTMSHALEYGSHMVSWIASGVFTRLPALKVVFVEGGFLWHRPIIARMTNHWDAKSGYLADVGKSPVECLRDHIRFSSQPLETAPFDRQLVEALRIAEADKLLLYSSDYPHFDYDDPQRTLPPNIDDELRRRIMCENAREFYDLPATRPVSRYDGPVSAA